MGGVPALPSPCLGDVASAWMKHQLVLQITRQHFSEVGDSKESSTGEQQAPPTASEATDVDTQKIRPWS